MRLLNLTQQTTPQGKSYTVCLEDYATGDVRSVRITAPQLISYAAFAAAVQNQIGKEFNFFVGPWDTIPISKRQASWEAVVRRLVAGNWFWAAASAKRHASQRAA